MSLSQVDRKGWCRLLLRSYRNFFRLLESCVDFLTIHRGMINICASGRDSPDSYHLMMNIFISEHVHGSLQNSNTNLLTVAAPLCLHRSWTIPLVDSVPLHILRDRFGSLFDGFFGSGIAHHSWSQHPAVRGWGDGENHNTANGHGWMNGKSTSQSVTSSTRAEKDDNGKIIVITVTNTTIVDGDGKCRTETVSTMRVGSKRRRLRMGMTQRRNRITHQFFRHRRFLSLVLHQ
jgi:hypothetical protein